MFIVRGLKGGRNFKKYISTRLLSTDNAALGKEIEAVARRYSKPVTVRELKVLKDNFSRSLFSGNVDKGIFEYPEVFRESDTDVVLKHSSEIEDFLKEFSDNTLSEGTIRKLREFELFGLSVPQKYGGAGYNETECKFVQECIGNSPRIARFLGYNENFGCKILNLYGTEEQKEKYLPRLAQGKSFISLAYLENGPLIDLSKIEGSAISDENERRYILTTQKKWVHNADKADLFLTMVKTTDFLDEEAEVCVNFNFFIVERDTPGVTVHQLKSEYAQQNDLFEVNFNEVSVKEENLLGSKNSDGFQILKSALSHCNVTDAAFCCNLLKQITHNVIQFIQEKNVNDASVIGHSFVQENLADLITYLYALESVVYLITGRYDTYDNPDLYTETVFAKIIAVDFLQIAVKKYIEILGKESFMSSGMLEEVIKTIQYYSVFDENIEYLKLSAAAEGFTYAASKLSQKVKILRNPFNNNWAAVKYNFSAQETIKKQLKKKINFKLELQECLTCGADFLSESYIRFLMALEDFFITTGALGMKNEHVIVKFGEIAAYLYAGMATLSRASSSLCYDFPGHHMECQVANAFAVAVDAKIKELHTEEIQHKNLLMYYKNLGEETFNRKEYPLEHPLSRTF